MGEVVDFGVGVWGVVGVGVGFSVGVRFGVGVAVRFRFRVSHAACRVTCGRLDDEVVAHQIDSEEQRPGVPHVLFAHLQGLAERGAALVVVSRVQNLTGRSLR